MRGSVNWACSGRGKDEMVMTVMASKSRMANVSAKATVCNLHRFPEARASPRLRSTSLHYARFERTLTTNPIIAATKKKE